MKGPPSFWSKVDIRAAHECWEWAGARSAGYGRFSFCGEPIGAHRISWQLQHERPVPEGMHVCHHCDNPACVNPEHLFLGTPQDNVRDMWAKGRARPIARKIDTRVARELQRAGFSQREIARRLGVAQPSVCLALRRAS